MSSFQFKQFAIEQDKCAMKVGTDGILFGSWIPVSGAEKHILDIGSGTGLLSLMMAQRCVDASIVGLEIDEKASIQAKYNAQQSKWSDRVDILAVDARAWNSVTKFDLIVSNPPYFVSSVLSETKSISIARHQVDFKLEDLVSLWLELGSDISKLACVLPVDQGEILGKLVHDKGGFLVSHTKVTNKPSSSHIRSLLVYSKVKAPTELSELSIRNDDGLYSDEYKSLTKDFYLGL